MRLLLCIAAATLLAGPPAYAQSGRPEALAWCLRQHGEDLDKVVAGCTWLIESGHETDSDLAADFKRRGDARGGQGDTTRQMADYNEAIRRNPSDAEIYASRAWLYYEAGDTEHAIEDATVVIRLRPSDPAAYVDRAAYFWHQHNADRALADYATAIALAPTDPKAYLERGQLLQDKGALDEALRDYDQAVRLKPLDTQALSLRGTARVEKGDLAGARADFTQAPIFFPHDVNAQADRCVVSWRLGDPVAAKTDCASAQAFLAKFNFPNVWPWAAEAGAYLLAGDDESAKKPLAEALRRNPNDAMALALRAVLLQRRGDATGSARDRNAAIAHAADIEHRITIWFGPTLLAHS